VWFTFLSGQSCYCFTFLSGPVTQVRLITFLSGLVTQVRLITFLFDPLTQVRLITFLFDPLTQVRLITFLHLSDWTRQKGETIATLTRQKGKPHW
jgi:hypothetical protein